MYLLMYSLKSLLKGWKLVSQLLYIPDLISLNGRQSEYSGAIPYSLRCFVCLFASINIYSNDELEFPTLICSFGPGNTII